MKIFVALAAIALALTACKQSSTSRLNDVQTGIINGTPITGPFAILAHNVVGLRLNGFIAANNHYKFNTCTGALVAPNVVLTAAHCLYPAYREGFVIFSTNMNTAPRSAYRRILETVTHPSYSFARDINGDELNDLALVRFEGEAPSDYYNAIPMHDAASLKTLAPIYEFGYGVENYTSNDGTGVLRKGKGQLLSWTDHHLEAWVKQDRQTLCHGDSGGPAFVVEQGAWKMMAIASRTMGNNLGESNCGNRAVYTLLLPYVPWLHSEIARLRKGSIL